MTKRRSINNKSIKLKPTSGITHKVKLTLGLSIMLVILAIVSAIELIMYVYLQDNIKGIQNGLTADFISNMKCFNKAMYSGNIQSIPDSLNADLAGGYTVKYFIVFDNNLNVVHSTLPKDALYQFNTPNNPASFKLKFSPEMDVTKLRTVYIKKGNYYLYLGLNQSLFLSDYLTEIQNFVQIFFSVILLLSIIVSFLLARSISKPMGKMKETVSAIANGDLSGRLDYTRYNEINELVEAYNRMANELQRLYSTLEAQVQDRTKELKSAYAELQNTQAMMVHSEKMKSLGELVAGIMHEINNPINFIYGNMTHLSNYSKDLIEVIELYSKYDIELSEENKKAVEELKETIDYAFLKTDMPDLIKSCKEGADRAKNIIQDLKSFSRMEELSISDVDLVTEIDTTLNILHNKIKNKAEIHKEYMSGLPKIEAFGGQLNQVFMNILDNAVGAIEKTGDIWIRINADKELKNLIIEIEDNGSGMDEETARKVFNPFFTTKPVGQGTGLGMTITYKIIKNHQGDISVTSKKGEGTKFTIRLPINIDRENLTPASIR